MTEATTSSPNLYALLIGIDCYMPNRLPNGSYYKNLGGCVRDINHVEAFLREERQVPAERILKLTASPRPDNEYEPIEAPEKLPTRKNIIDSFRKLSLAPAGTQVYIQYSGHGGRAKTVYPEIKGENGIDEGLVPTDIGTSEGQYLRDLELAELLKELVDKNLLITLVLDCCHSGGATRGDVAIRGMDVIDDKPLQPSFEPVAATEVLASHWKSLNEQGTRGLKAAGLPESRDYVLLAACRQNEFAYEFAFNRETKERNGALTFWLLDTLRQQRLEQTYKDLYDRISAKIHSQFPQQTPMLLGEGSRKIFSGELGETVNAVPVLKVERNAETDEMQALLGVGQANGLGKGAEFAIYPNDVTDFTNKESRVAIARIVQRGGTESLCNLKPVDGKVLKVEEGDRAVLVSPSVNLVRKVALFSELANASDPAVSQQEKGALEAIKTALSGNGWVELAEEVVADDDDGGTDYQVVIKEKKKNDTENSKQYEICDRTGHPFAGISPIDINEADAAATVVKRLVHLAKYHAALELDNMDKDSPLAGKLIVKWLGTSDTYEPGDKTPPRTQLKPFTDGSKPTVKKGEYIFLSIQNTASQPLNVAVLDLASDWSIEQVYPGKTENFITIDEGQQEVIPLPAGAEGEDVVKVFATVGMANFRWLELPSLDQELHPKGFATRSSNPLEVILAAIDDEKPKTRKLSVAASPSREWTTAQIPLTVVK